MMFVMTCAVCLHVLFMSHDLIRTRRAIYWTTPVLLFFPLSNTIIRTQHTAMFDPPRFYTVSKCLSFHSFIIIHQEIYQLTICL